jgi:hypothetical protein
MVLVQLLVDGLLVVLVDHLIQVSVLVEVLVVLMLVGLQENLEVVVLEIVEHTQLVVEVEVLVVVVLPMPPVVLVVPAS